MFWEREIKAEFITINVLPNDVDIDGDALSVQSVTNPAHSQLIRINPDNTISYIPSFGFNGEDSFTYTISDGQFLVSATVTINVIEF